ncbi:MAG TPA: amino acid adenylation domain-containing protein [Mariniphaga sp.]|nr:amino acid adenylation domain-containing protein [Mariniphaga sp.]
MNKTPQRGIAIIGMAGKFPGAVDIEQFWSNIVNGIESIRYFSDKELHDAGVEPQLLDNPSYVKGYHAINDVELFDAEFFGMSPREASLTDPQHRIFLESAWEALEDGGYDPSRYKGSIGVFAGCNPNGYLLYHVLPSKKTSLSSENYQIMIGNNNDFLTTRTSYKFNLVGPSIGIQSACSSSLAAIHTACNYLYTFQCDMALAGGVSLQFPRNTGYLYENGHILSPDGHCRPFSINAQGTVCGEGCGVVLLKRLTDAIEQGDSIYAAIIGSSVNNDGSLKVGYTAPSVDGQAAVVTMAQELANINPETIEFIEAHGTGTKLGDPIEVTALTRSFREMTSKRNFCALGSIKGNIGHLDAAAGVAGLLKASLSLKNRLIPPNINFDKANTELNIENSPFFIPESPLDWPQKDYPRRAGVSSYGIGGTNVHVILQEPPSAKHIESSRIFHIIPISAKSDIALEEYTSKASSFLSNTSSCCADIAYTMQNGRKEFPYRRTIICSNNEDGVTVINKKINGKFFSGNAQQNNNPVVFMFTGQGSQYSGMCHNLYNSEPVFKQYFDYCSDILSSQSNISIKQYILTGSLPSNDSLTNTSLAQPLLFVIEFSMSKLLMNYGIYPSLLIGHSIGEVTAACIADVFSLETGLKLVTLRGNLMESTPTGAMVSVSLPVEELQSYLNNDLVCAAINSPSQSVLSGPLEQIQEIEKNLSSQGISFRRLHTSHAFHSPMMNSASKSFQTEISGFEFNKPCIPFISNITGDFISDNDAVSPEYWARQICSCVNFSGGIETLIKENSPIFIECGPGTTLCSLVSNHSGLTNLTIPSIPHAKNETDGNLFFAGALSKLWCNGLTVDWSKIYSEENRKRVSTPTYPFQRKRFWIDISDQPKSLLESDPEKEKSKDPIISYNNFDKDDKLTLVSNLWRDLLGLETINPNDNFFNLGGDSLLCTQLLSRIKQSFPCNLTVQDLLQSPSLSSMTQTVFSNENDFNNNDTISIVPGKVDKNNQPLSPSQKRIWFMYRLEPQSAAFNIVQAFEYEGEIDSCYIKKALQSISEIQESLRTVFNEEDGVPYSTITDIPDFDIRIIPEDQDELVKKEIRKPFQLEKGPLVRIVISRNNRKGLLLLVMHHIISDGWSMGILATELIKRLGQIDQPINQTSLKLQYADYALWLNESEKNNKYSDHIQFWKNQLEGDLPVLELPSDHPRPPEFDYSGSQVNFTINPEITGKLKEIAGNQNATLYMLLLTVYSVFLKKYTSQSDIIIGSPIANRISVEIEHVIGFFLNMLPIRIKFNQNTTFLEFLQNVKSVVFESMTYQDFPFEKIVEAVKPVRDISHTPVFQTMFAFQNFPFPVISNSSIKLEPVFIDRGITQYDLSLYMWEKDGSLNGSFEYSTELFEKETAEQFVSHFNNLILSVASNHDNFISEINMFSDKEFHKLIYEWNDTNTCVPEFCLPGLIRNQAVLNPQKIAIVSGTDNYTYLQLIERVKNIAASLLLNHAETDPFIGVMTSRSFDMVAAILAIHTVGSAYVPIDPNYPQDRINMMIQDAGINTVVSETGFKDNLPDVNIHKLFLDTIPDSSESKNIWDKSSPDKTAYIIYTSGSTGKPKGVEISHKALANFLLSMQDKPGIIESDSLLAVTTLSFDISILELFLPLITGAKLIIANHETVADGNLLSSIISDSDISIMQATPATWRLLLTTGWPGNKTLKALCGGEAMPSDLIEELLPRVKELWNMYGPTETTVWSTCYRITDKNDPVLIGKPIRNTRIYILDHDMKPVPVGSSGNLYIGGAGLSSGYHNRPDLTSKVFIQNPFLPDERIYRTGDIARYHNDGNIEYLNRADTQVKVRGFRIELGDVESALASHPSVLQCAAACYEFSPGDVRLSVYYVPADIGSVTITDLRNYLKNIIPPYMIPQHFIELDKLPLTPAGKIDRKRLPPPFINNSVSESRDLQSPEEIYLANIWKIFLKIDKVGSMDNFFDLGGHSLLSMQVLAKIKKDTGYDIHPREMILNTLEQIAERITISEHPTNLIKDDSSIFEKLNRIFGKRNHARE